MRVRGTLQAFASAPGESPSGNKNSSRRTSPGCMGASRLAIDGSPWFEGREEPLVIVRQFNVFWPIRGPDKANPELVIDADRVLARAITLERFKPIAG